MIQLSKQSAYFRVPDISEHDTKEIKKNLDVIPGVLAVSVNSSTNKVAVDFDSTGTNPEELNGQLEHFGYHAQLLKNEDHTM